MRKSANHIAIQSRTVKMIYLPGTEQPQIKRRKVTGVNMKNNKETAR